MRETLQEEVQGGRGRRRHQKTGRQWLIEGKFNPEKKR